LISYLGEQAFLLAVNRAGPIARDPDFI